MYTDAASVHRRMHSARMQVLIFWVALEVCVVLSVFSIWCSECSDKIILLSQWPTVFYCAYSSVGSRASLHGKSTKKIKVQRNLCGQRRLKSAQQGLYYWIGTCGEYLNISNDANTSVYNKIYIILWYYNYYPSVYSFLILRLHPTRMQVLIFGGGLVVVYSVLVLCSDIIIIITMSRGVLLCMFYGTVQFATSFLTLQVCKKKVQ